MVTINVSEAIGYKSGILMNEPLQRWFPGLTFKLDNACLLPQDNYSLKNIRIRQIK